LRVVRLCATLSRVDEPIVERDEVAALLFNVADIARTLERIEALLGGDGGEEETDEG
jgi:hypothetical protein